MNRKIRFLALVLISLSMFACHRETGNIYVKGMYNTSTYMPQPVVNSPYKVRVEDVSNDTHHVYDVDVIGLLWNGIENSLKKRGMLWEPQSKGDPYVMKGHVVYFSEGSLAERFLPYLGDTVLEVKVDISRDGRHIATIKAKRKISFGRGTLTFDASRKIFGEVSEDVVKQAIKKF